jgi:hypothetical protein
MQEAQTGEVDSDITSIELAEQDLELPTILWIEPSAGIRG